ncbi:hypothetical protein ACFS7Z_19605 [Pontibacter toksunensis]|uniref:Uncharacterized protein n=1 Tax=Pontibacter toksunensis TaxID=1332631 RepID=A0ABW6BZG5_9BACT
MVSYRITKFNPTKRNEEGHYLDDSEWTAISDIGKAQYNNVTYQEYETIETAYVKSIQLILREKNRKSLRIDSLELYDTKEDFDRYKKDGRLRNLTVDFENEISILKNKDELSLSQIEKFTRLMLRETIWMLLVDRDIEVRFGYDYYMYVKCEELASETMDAIHNLGLFVEPNVGQIDYKIIDEDGNEIK